MDLLNSELDSSNETRVTSTGDGKEVTGIEAERVSDISEVADQETVTIPAMKKEPNISPALFPCWRRKDVRSERSVMAGKQMSINDLPDEMLLEVLSYVGPEDLGLNITQICKRWNVLAKDVVLWKKLSYRCDCSSDISHIIEVLTVAPALHSLTICRHGRVADILKFLVNKHIDLRKLIMKNCDLREGIPGIFANFMDLYQDLEGLSLEGCTLFLSGVFCHIARLKKLSELNLSVFLGLSGETVRLIVDSCQHLKKLSLDGVTLTDDDDVIHVIKKLGKQLTTLLLCGIRLTDVAYLYLRNCTRLQELEISLCDQITDRGLLEGIGSLQELTSLHLHKGRNLTAQALSKFLHRPSMTSIVFLKLSDCTSLDDEALKVIAKRCIHLKELAVCWCVVTDAGMSMVISHCNQLCVLDLMGLPSITGEGWLALLPSCLPHLRELSLVNCDNVCDNYVEELMAALPELEVFRHIPAFK